jgi:peptide/nickel transport system substrate-binding protein
MADHQRLLREAFAANRGEEIDTQGDSFLVAFRSARDALVAAIAIQRSLVAHAWPEGSDVRIRIGIHTGEAAAAGERYVGLSVHRAARVGAAAHGGQVLLSSSTRELVEDDLPEGVFVRDLGVHRLKDIDRPERISQLAAEGLQVEFPPLRGAEPVKPSPILRRRSLLAATLAGVVAAAVAIPVFAIGGGSGGSNALAGVDANAVGAIDASKGRVVGSIPVGTSPGSVVFGEQSVWVTNADAHSVSRIDPTTNAVVQTIQVGSGPAGVAVGGGFVWVANGLEGTVSKIDPNENNGTVVETLQVGNAPTGIAFGGGSVWVVNSSDRTLMRIDPHTSTVSRPIPVGAGADSVAVGGGLVWVTSESGNSVSRINIKSGTVLPPIRVGNGPSAVAVGPESAWVANALDGTVSRIDPKAGTVVKVIPVGDTPTGIAITGNTVWVSNERAGTLARIDPAQNSVVQTVKTANRPEGVAASGNAIYIAVRASGLAHRGGTLTVLETASFDSIDPALAYFGPASMILTNDGLTGYRRVGGSDGGHLVADLAISLPVASDGGRAYTFQLRHGIHYSNGALVRPADFRRALERSVAKHGGTAFYFSGIVGAGQCAKSPKRCDLSKGIVADPASNTVTFHLTAPDPDFLHKLALPAAFAVPAGTPLKARLPLPATGPYMIASYNAKRGARFVRNPRFHQWSAAAQPTGYPDEITLRIAESPKAQLRAVEQGAVDLFQGVPSSPELAAFRSRYAGQLESNPYRHTGYFFLNTRVPPFNDVRVRRAVNFALDRNWEVELNGGPGFARPTCQVLPPNADGYRRYCPYTIDPRADGRYTGPDLAKARKLVTESGTRGQSVTVRIGPGYVRFAAVVVSTLQSLGYKARLKVIPFPRYGSVIADSRSKAQTGGQAWYADYLSASNFFYDLLTCASFRPRSAENLNQAEFCNRRIDSEIARARSLQTSDPQAASQLWSKIDRDVVDQAPWVAVNNLNVTDFVSRRVGNYQYNPQWAALLDQIWVK